MRPSGCLSAGNKTAILKRHLDSEEGGRERRPIGRASAVVTRPLGAGGDGGAGRDEGKREGWRTASRASPRNEVPNGMQTQSRRKTGGWPPSSRLVQLAHAPLTVTHFIVPSTQRGRCSYRPDFTDEETEAQREERTLPKARLASEGRGVPPGSLLPRSGSWPANHTDSRLAAVKPRPSGKIESSLEKMQGFTTRRCLSPRNEGQVRALESVRLLLGTPEGLFFI